MDKFFKLACSWCLIFVFCLAAGKCEMWQVLGAYAVFSVMLFIVIFKPNYFANRKLAAKYKHWYRHKLTNWGSFDAYAETHQAMRNMVDSGEMVVLIYENYGIGSRLKVATTEDSFSWVFTDNFFKSSVFFRDEETYTKFLMKVS